VTSVERGILVGGRVAPGTDFVLRDPAAWWRDGERGTRGRQGRAADTLVGHWTGGHPHEGPLAGPKVVRAMRARTRDDGSPMDVGIHFVVGWDGLVWQTADLAVGTTHAGKVVNARSIGVETCWPGLASQAERLGVTFDRVDRRLVRGVAVKCIPPSDALVAAWVRLAEALVRLPAPVAIERRVGAIGRGAIEHQLVPGTTKLDAGGYLLDALVAAGWSR